VHITLFVSLLFRFDMVSPLSYKMGASPHGVADRRLIEWEFSGKFGLADLQLPGRPITQNTPSLHPLVNHGDALHIFIFAIVIPEKLKM
jgi:hypothetical protein